MISSLIPEFGTLFLICALLSALGLVFSPKATKYYVSLETLFIALAYVSLTLCFLRDDFTVRYILLNSSVSLPWFYKLCAVWGGHEGSMLLWVLILSGWMFLIAWLSPVLERDFYQTVLKVLGLLSIGFLLFLLCTSNPFLRQFEVLNSSGRDLNPLLQDPGFLFHPPMLYMGYVGFSVAFALAIAALYLGRIEKSWARWARPWTIAAWCALTLGITLGSWWAYRELGWGGYWFWDPVENASFMPWLIGTALLHALIVIEKQAEFKAWTVLLAIVAFSLSLIGTFLVRSGVLTSVHAFAVDPMRGLYILLFLLVVVGGSLALFAKRFDTIRDKKPLSLMSREGGLLLNNVFLSVAMLTVLLGTTYPLIIDALALGKLSVGAPYFNAVFVPLMLPFLALMGVGIHMRSKHDDYKRLLHLLKLSFLLSMLIPALIMVYLKSTINPLVYLSIGVSFWVILATLKSLISRIKNKVITTRFLGMVIAHIGVGVTALGISLTAGFSIEEDVKIAPNEVISFAGYQVKLSHEQQVRVQNYESTQVCLSFSKHNKVFEICPEKRFYTVGRVVMSEAGIHIELLRDLYVALGEPQRGNAWSFRLLYKPGIRFIWGGGFLILFGGLFALVRFKQVRHV